MTTPDPAPPESPDANSTRRGTLAGYGRTSTAPAQQAAGSAFGLRQQDRHTDTVTLRADEASAPGHLAQHTRRHWDNAAKAKGLPSSPPAGDRDAVDLDHGPEDERVDKGHQLYDADIRRHPPTKPTPRGFRFPDEEFCAEANSTAVFHPMTGPDDDGLPCIEVGGILVFAYLDADIQAVRVSVDLDTTAAPLVRDDSTVPLHLEVGNATVFSAGAGPLPASSRPRRLRRPARRIRAKRRKK
ncbi:hypothetical protein AB0G76_31350 [Streptomyces asoensis]|uniref:hypothetical protein n=1 Tax=Streptomyces asoensis TaxID=249586 RepID=UPI00340F0FD8